MKSNRLFLSITLFVVTVALSAQSPFALNLRVGNSNSTFEASLVNISEVRQVVRRGGKTGRQRTLSLIIVDAAGDSSFVRPNVVGTEDHTRNLAPGDSLLFRIDVEPNDVPQSGNYSLQLIYHSIYRKHDQLPKNSPLRRAYQGEINSNILFID